MHAEQLVDWKRLEAELRGLERPGFVLGVRLTMGEDATGDEAIWVWLRVEPDSTAQPGAKDALHHFKERIRATVSELAPGVWPYIRLEN